MSNTLLTIDMVTKDALMVLENMLTFTKFIRRKYDSSFGISGAQIGDTLRIRKPVRYITTDGPGFTAQNSTETYTTLTLNKYKQVGIRFTSKEQTLSINNYREQFIVPAVAALANQMDLDGMALYKDVYNSVGSPGSVPTDPSVYLAAGVALDNQAAPRDERRANVMSPVMQAALARNQMNLFGIPPKTVDEQYIMGTIGKGLGFRNSMDQNVNTHTTGAYAGTPLMKGATLSGATTIDVDGFTSTTGTAKKGDVITIDGVYEVNPQNRQSTGELQRFVITADTDAAAGEIAALPISPAIVSSGAFQTVDSLPADNAPVTWYSAASQISKQGMAFHPDAFAMASADLILPDSLPAAAKSRVSDDQLGISIRMLKYFDGDNDRENCRLDILYGFVTQRPEIACRIWS